MKNELKNLAKLAGIDLDEIQLDRFITYYQFLLEYNQKVNLTAITDQEIVFVKHFIDSIYPLRFFDIDKHQSLIDIGTGAGFPSVPVKIMRPDIELTLLDSLLKRLEFLDELSGKLDLDFNLVHQRAEDINEKQREAYDFAVSRAVAPLRVLSEYDIPYVKEGGIFIAYKGKDIFEELEDAKTAIDVLGGEIQKTERYELLDKGERSVVIVKKIRKTDDKYPRRAKKIERDRL